MIVDNVRAGVGRWSGGERERWVARMRVVLLGLVMAMAVPALAGDHVSCLTQETYRNLAVGLCVSVDRVASTPPWSPEDEPFPPVDLEQVLRIAVGFGKDDRRSVRLDSVNLKRVAVTRGLKNRWIWILSFQPQVPRDIRYPEALEEWAMGPDGRPRKLGVLMNGERVSETEIAVSSSVSAEVVRRKLAAAAKE